MLPGEIRLARIPEYDLSLSASGWSELIGVEDHTMERDANVIDQGRFRVRISGNCMSPAFPDGSLVECLIVRLGRDSMPVGDPVVLTNSDGQSTFKRLVSFDADAQQLVLRADNKKHKGELRVPLDMVARIAVAVGHFTPVRVAWRPG